MNRRAVTLLEVLAATVLLGLIAAAITPILLRIGHDVQHGEQMLAAEGHLARSLGNFRMRGFPLGNGSQAIPQQPGWTVEWTTLEQAIVPGGAPPVIAHRWIQVRVQGPDPTVLAERVVPAALTGGALP